MTPWHALSGPVLRDTARLSQRYPPIARYGGAASRPSLFRGVRQFVWNHLESVSRHLWSGLLVKRRVREVV